MTLRCTALSDAQALDTFVRGLVDSRAVLDRLRGDMEAGTVRPEWCWSAYDGDRVVARHHWWGPIGAETPVVLAPLDAPDENLDAAIALVEHARAAVDPHEVWSEVTLKAEPGDEDRDPWSVRPDRVQLLERTGFTFEVDRVRIEWRHGTALPAETVRLAFHPATDFAEDELVALLAAVADGSLDHSMVGDRVRLGRDGEARKRLAFNGAYPGVDGRFVIATDETGATVGYVVPALQGELGVVAEIGVAQPHRGRGHVNDLLAHATRTLVAAGARRIVADTDCANVPMRAAFARGGYVEFARRWDWGWRRTT